MSDTLKETDDGDASSALPRHTTPTWEVELLISGVAVFAMLQLPGWLDDQYFALMPRFDDTWGSIVVMAYLYFKSVALILSVTFALHLLQRARWIALVGMYSVHPEGIQWDRLRLGPLQRKAEHDRFGDRAVSIDRADNRATTVFAIGVMLASALLLIIVSLGFAFGVVMLLVRGLGLPIKPGVAFYVVFSLLLLPNIAARMIDRRYGERLKQGGRLYRVLVRVFELYTRTGLLGRGSNPTLALMASRGGERRVILIVMGLMLLAFTCVGLGYVSMKNPESFGSYALFPQAGDGTRSIDSAHYADQRNPTRDEAVPFLQSAVIASPYARLVVPYDPQRDEAALRARCRGIATLQGDARATALRGCLQTQRAVSLDGKPLLANGYDLGSDAATDRPALVMMIDVRDLPRGRHELQVARAPRLRADDDGTGTETEPQFDRIAFWR